MIDKIKEQFINNLNNKKYIECKQILNEHKYILKEKDMYVYLFSFFCFICDFQQAKLFFLETIKEDVKYEYDMLQKLVDIAKDMQYCNEILELYYCLIKRTNKQIGIMEIGDSLIDGKDYLKARNFYKNIFKIFSNNFIALKHTAQLSNFICDFNTTKEVVTQDVLNVYKNDDFKYNILLNEKEIAEHKLYLESKPRTMLIAVTTKCNIKCLMCTRDKIWDIPEHVKNEIVTMFKYLEVVVWQGGEVFLYKHFFELLTLSKINENIRHIIITNGLFFTDKWIDLLLSIKNLDLTVSIDGTTKDVYEKIRIGASFEKLNENLARFYNRKKQVDSNISLTLRCAIMRSNYKQIVDFIKFAVKYGFNIVIFAPVQNLYTDENIWNNLTDEMNDYIYEQYIIAEKLAKQNNINVITWLPVRKRETSCVKNNNDAVDTQQNIEDENKNNENAKERDIMCFRPWKQVVLNVDGFITPECLCQKQITTIEKLKSFSEIWNCDIMQEYRKKLQENNYEWCNKDCISGSIAEEHLKFISR